MIDSVVGKGDLILDSFTEVEFGVESLIVTLKDIEEQYEGLEHIKIKAYLNVSIRNLNSIHKDLKETINELDDYLMNERESKRLHSN